eukprot:SAG31_NODE_1518_length_8029_cov_43.028247_2_plen_45_part_00
MYYTPSALTLRYWVPDAGLYAGLGIVSINSIKGEHSTSEQPVPV